MFKLIEAFDALLTLRQSKQDSKNQIRSISQVTNLTDSFLMISEWKEVHEPVFNQCSTSIPSENIRKPRTFSDVFKGYRSGTLVENELICLHLLNIRGEF